MNMAILVLNSKYIHASLAPWYLFAAIKENNENADVKVIESTINRTVNDTLKDVLQYNPHILACSCYIWNIEKTLEIAREYKNQNPNAIIILGGPEVSYRAEQVLSTYCFVDFVISGEGELPIAMLHKALCNGDSCSNIPGVSFKKQGGLQIAEPYVTVSEPPNPYSAEFLQALNGRICYIEGSRGCPYNCAFCLSGRCGGVRLFGLERIKNDIITLANSGSKTIKFVDRTFNAHRQRAMEIWSFIIENCGKLFPNSVCFHFEIAGDLLDSHSLALLKNAPKGLIQVEIGLQSFNDKTLTYINRKTNVERLISNIKELASFGNIHLHIDLIAGLPYEDFQSFRNGFNTAFYLGAENLQLGFLKLLYGAPMREISADYPCEYSSSPPYEVTATPWLTNGEILRLKNTEDALERLSNSGRFKNTLKYLVTDLGLEPFSLFHDFGNEYFNNQNITLNSYFEMVFDFFSLYEQTDNIQLRDALVLDKLICDHSGYIPNKLRTADPRLKQIKAVLNQRYGGKGKKLGIAILYSKGERVVCVDYSSSEVHFLDIALCLP